MKYTPYVVLMAVTGPLDNFSALYAMPYVISFVRVSIHGWGIIMLDTWINIKKLSQLGLLYLNSKFN
jgi:hypothetical protein